MKIGISTTSLYNRQRINNNYSFCAKRSLSPLTPQQQQLVEENLALVDFVMSPNFYQSKDNLPIMQNLKTLLRGIMTHIDSSDTDKYEDYNSAGLEGLVYAARKYNPQKGAFSPYACCWIAQKIIREYQKQLKEYPPKDFSEYYDPSHVVYCNLEIGTDARVISLNRMDSSKTPLYALIPDTKTLPPEDITIKEEEKKIIQDYITSLDERTQDIIKMHYEDGATLEEIGKKYNITKQRVRQIIDRCEKIIRTIFYIKNNAKKTIDEIAKETGLGPRIVRNILHQLGIGIKTKREARNKEIVEMYQGGAEIDKIAKEKGLSPATVQNILYLNGINTKGEREARNKEIVEMYQGGAEIDEIAKEKGLSPATVTNILHKNGININKKPEREKRNQEIMEKHKAGIPVHKIAEAYSLSESYISHIIQQSKANQSNNNGLDLIA